MPLADFHAILQSIPEKGWARIDTNSPQDVFPPEDKRGDSHSLTQMWSIWTAWAGFAYIPTAKWMLIFGGGHANTSYDGPFHFDFNDLQWHRTFLPTRVFNPFNDGNTDWPDISILAKHDYLWADSPISAHCYQQNVYLATLDLFATLGGAEQGQGGLWRKYDIENSNLGNVGPYLLDWTLADPDKVAGATGTNWKTAINGDITGANAWTVVDKGAAGQQNAHADVRVENGVDVIYYGSNSLIRFEIPANLNNAVRTVVGNGTIGALGASTGCIWESLNAFIAVGRHSADSSNKWAYWDISDTGTASDNVRFFPDPDLLSGGGLNTDHASRCALRYDPVRDRGLLIDRQGRMWALHAPETLTTTGWVTEEIEPSTTAKPSQDGQFADRQVFGMWQYAPEYDVFLHMGAEGQVWVWKPENWSPTAIDLLIMDRRWDSSIAVNDDRLWRGALSVEDGLAGTLAATELADTLAASGEAAVAGTLAATEVTDTFAASGTQTVTGVLATTESADTLAVAGEVAIAGTLAVTEAVDTLAAVGAVAVAGTLAVTESVDTLAATGDQPITGTLTTAEAVDALVAFGSIAVTGNLAGTEAPDTFAASGTQTTIGTISATESADTLAAAGGVALAGILVVTEIADTFAGVLFNADAPGFRGVAGGFYLSKPRSFILDNPRGFRRLS